MAYYVVPDIHGNLEGLNRAIEHIFKVFDLEKDKLVFLGDYIDRGKQSKQVLETLFNLEKKYGSDKIIILLGNHDDMFIKYLESTKNISFLLNDTDLSTINSFVGDYFSLCDLRLNYSYQIINSVTNEDYTYKVISYIKSEYKELLEWYQKLPLYYDKIEEENLLFVHAGIEETVLGISWKEYTTNEQLIWKYPVSYGVNPYGFDIIAGHVMVDELWKFSEEPCYDIYKSFNHYYLDGASPYNKTLNILKIELDSTNGNKFYDYNKNKEII